MRIFTAIPVPTKSKELLTDICRNKLPINFLDTTNLHVTLNFFGDVPDDKVPQIQKIFSAVIINSQPPVIIMEKVVVFRRQIHIVLEKNVQLIDVQNRLEQAFVENGFEFQNRPYYPHIKLANLRDDRFLHQNKSIDSFPNRDLSKAGFISESAVLYESKLLLSYAKHTPLLEVNFKL
jgi:2'-5' RNA ligase